MTCAAVIYAADVAYRSVALAVSMIGLALMGAAATMAVRRTRMRR